MDSFEGIIKQALAELGRVKSKEELEFFRIAYLGKNGTLNKRFKELINIAQDKKVLGSEYNQVKTTLEERILIVSQSLEKGGDKAEAWVDVTASGEELPLGHLHPVSQAIEEIVRIFEKIGFARVRYPEVDWDWYAFGALNMPVDHPARDEWETFLLEGVKNKKFGGRVLTPHTSNGQVREMERVGKPPIRMLNVGKCYRRQQDVTHTAMFHQFEGLVIDKGINIQHLKGTLDYFARKFYGPEAKSRIRPFMFKFTEPSFEVDFSCTNCSGTGMVGGERCRFCKAGWHEVGGQGWCTQMF